MPHVVSLRLNMFYFVSSRRRHTRYWRDWSSDVCSSDLLHVGPRQADIVQRLIVHPVQEPQRPAPVEPGFPAQDDLQERARPLAAGGVEPKICCGISCRHDGSPSMALHWREKCARARVLANEKFLPFA